MRIVSSLSLIALLSLSSAFDFADFEKDISGYIDNSLDKFEHYFDSNTIDDEEVDYAVDVNAISCSSCKVAMKSFDAIF